MRIKRHNYGDEKIISKFLWFPLTIDDETRWLERVKYKKRFLRYEESVFSFNRNDNYNSELWEYEEWIDD